MADIQKPDNIFVNCPFDNEYKAIFDAIVFTIFDCGFIARCAKEVDDSSEVRIDQISRIIKECKFGIHDISRTELNDHQLPRFNMPFELGLFLGAKKYGTGKQKDKSCLILDTEKYRYKEFISDIGGQDIKAYSCDIEKCIKVVRGWLNNKSGRKTLPGGKAIFRRYTEFLDELPDVIDELQIEADEVTFNDLANFVSNWLIENE